MSNDPQKGRMTLHTHTACRTTPVRHELLRRLDIDPLGHVRANKPVEGGQEVLPGYQNPVIRQTDRVSDHVKSHPGLCHVVRNGSGTEQAHANVFSPCKVSLHPLYHRRT
jgi:hypothetical protein